MVATLVLLLVYVPPVEGESVVVSPIHNSSGPVKFGVIVSSTVIEIVFSDRQPLLESVKLKTAVPGLWPVTIPEPVTVAMEGLLLVHVPPEDGNKLEFSPMQMFEGPFKLTGGPTSTVTGPDVCLEHPVVDDVKVK